MEKKVKKFEKLDTYVNDNIITYRYMRPNGSYSSYTYTKTKLKTYDQKLEMVKMIDDKVKRKDICLKYDITLPTLKKYELEIRKQYEN